MPKTVLVPKTVPKTVPKMTPKVIFLYTRTTQKPCPKPCFFFGQTTPFGHGFGHGFGQLFGQLLGFGQVLGDSKRCWFQKSSPNACNVCGLHSYDLGPPSSYRSVGNQTDLHQICAFWGCHPRHPTSLLLRWQGKPPLFRTHHCRAVVAIAQMTPWDNGGFQQERPKSLLRC